MVDYYTSKNIGAGVVMIVILLLLFLRFGGKSGSKNRVKTGNVKYIDRPVEKEVEKEVEKIIEKEPDFDKIIKEVKERFAELKKIKKELLENFNDLIDSWKNDINPIICQEIPTLPEISMALKGYKTSLNNLNVFFQTHLTDLNAKVLKFNDFEKSMIRLNALINSLKILAEKYGSSLDLSDLQTNYAALMNINTGLVNDFQLVSNLVEVTDLEELTNKPSDEDQLNNEIRYFINRIFPDWSEHQLLNKGKRQLPGLNSFPVTGRRGTVQYNVGEGFAGPTGCVQEIINMSQNIIYWINNPSSQHRFAGAISNENAYQNLVNYFYELKLRCVHYFLFLFTNAHILSRALDLEKGLEPILQRYLNANAMIRKHPGFNIWFNNVNTIAAYDALDLNNPDDIPRIIGSGYGLFDLENINIKKSYIETLVNLFSDQSAEIYNQLIQEHKTNWDSISNLIQNLLNNNATGPRINKLLQALIRYQGPGGYSYLIRYLRGIGPKKFKQYFNNLMNEIRNHQTHLDQVELISLTQQVQIGTLGQVNTVNYTLNHYSQANSHVQASLDLINNNDPTNANIDNYFHQLIYLMGYLLMVYLCKSAIEELTT